MSRIAIIKSNDEIKYPATITEAIVDLNYDKRLDVILDELYNKSFFRGLVNQASDIYSLRDYKKGLHWIVNTEGRYVGQDCEVGDMIYCIKDYTGMYKIEDFEVLQSNLEPITNEDIDNLFI